MPAPPFLPLAILAYKGASELAGAITSTTAVRNALTFRLEAF